MHTLLDSFSAFSRFLWSHPVGVSLAVFAATLSYWALVRFWKFFIVRRCPHCGWPMTRRHERDATFCGAPYDPRRAHVVTLEVCSNPFRDRRNPNRRRCGYYRTTEKGWREFSPWKLRWDRVKRAVFGHD